MLTFFLTIFATFSLALSCWEYILPLNEPFVEDFSLQFIELMKSTWWHLLWLFRQQLPVVFVFYAPPNTKDPFIGMQTWLCSRLCSVQKRIRLWPLSLRYTTVSVTFIIFVTVFGNENGNGNVTHTPHKREN